MVTLLKALASGDTDGAKTDLAQLKKDLSAEESSTSSSTTSSLTKDVVSLLKDLTSGNTSAAKTDLTNLQKDMNADGSSSSSTTQTSPLDTLIANLETALNSGSTQDALQSLASYLVQSGQGTGGLVDTTA
jgi:hypothetical protein